MKIKPRPTGITRKQRAYLKWMGLIKPKKVGRLGQLQKLNRRLRRDSEFVALAKELEPEGVSCL